ncbi:MAG: S46 family peptidase [Gemmatimonadota bacterium]|nr:MAG: S46 family peptidase [Gemmatimonadota bacterium]
MRMIWRRLERVTIVAVLLLAPLGSAVGQAGVADPDAVRAGRFDYGKMWTFEYAPGDYFTETYGFEANAAWFERARLSVLRIPGCSASFVSPNGLVATNHHCVRSRVSQVSEPGEGLLDNGFFARSLEAERRIPGYYADQLLAAVDVSDEVFAAVDAAPPPERDRVLRRALDAIEARLKREYAARGDSIWVQSISLYNGGRHSAYVFRRFTDVRLVAAVELELGFFGGDPDNFTYPRYALDFAFLRVYGADGQPYRPDHYFGWSMDGVEQGDVVFVIGNPGSTNRLQTIAQLEYQRDVEVPARIAWLAGRHRALDGFRVAAPVEAEAMDVRNRMFSLSNSLKASTGRLAALEDERIMARKADAEQQLREAIEGNPALRVRYGGLFDRLAEIQAELRAVAAPTAAFYRLAHATYGSATMRRALAAWVYARARAEGVGGDTLAALGDSVLAVDDKPFELEWRYLGVRLADLAAAYGPDHPITRAALRGQTADQAARRLLSESLVRDAASAAAAIEGGTLVMGDPMLQLVTALLPEYQRDRVAVGRLDAEERELASDLGRVRFEVYGRDVPPDGTSSPRVTDGVVMSYEYNGTLAPPYTTFFGLYDRFRSHGGAIDWSLPERWQAPPAGLDLRTPLNFVSTADTYGGNSGSPAVTPALELVGLNFDRNIQGLSRDFIYLPERGRNIMVDVRAIRATLDHVYDLDRIVSELDSGRLFTTEEEADAARR